MPGNRIWTLGYRVLVIALVACTLVASGAPSADAPQPLPDLNTVKPDLVTPPMTEGPPAPGKRVRVTRPEYAGSEVYHALYLPRDWKPDRRYPVIVEYAGNGPYSNAYGDISTGRPEGSNLGYGISGGKGFIWICMPYVNTQEKRIQTQWWGDVPATLTYCRRTIADVCDRYGGDPSAVILAGFSRGAIACGYLGLDNDEIAGTWRAFIAYSHYDGARTWPYPGSDAASATERLRRLRGRPSFICHEAQDELDRTRRFIEASGVTAPITYRVTPYRNHSDAWTLRPSPLRKELRAWLRNTLRHPTRPQERANAPRWNSQAPESPLFEEGRGRSPVVKRTPTTQAQASPLFVEEGLGDQNDEPASVLLERIRAERAASENGRARTAGHGRKGKAAEHPGRTRTIEPWSHFAVGERVGTSLPANLHPSNNAETREAPR